MIKVVCCGLPKTGTKSMIKAFDLLDYIALHSTSIQMIERFNVEVIAEAVAVYMWKELYYKYPEAKFILTTRSDWVRRVKGKADNKGTKKLRFGDGSQEFYDNHCGEIREFFSDKPNQFLEMNLFEGDGWKKLCGFLGIRCSRIKKTPFPNVKINRETTHQNKNRLGTRNKGRYMWK